MLRRNSTRPLLAILCLAAWLALVPALAAQNPPANWQPLLGPGGRITLLAAAPDAQELYAVSVGGVNRRSDQTQWQATGSPLRSDALYHSTDGGATWQPATNDLPPGPISALYLDPKENVLYVAVQGVGDEFTRRYGLWRSTHQKTHWERVTLDRDDLLIRRVTRTADSDSLLLGAVDAGDYPDSYVYRLTADGRWTSTQALRFDQRPGSIMADLVAHPKAPTRLFITTHGGDLLVSEDAGGTWSLAQTSVSPTTSGTVPQLAFSPDQPDTALLVRSVTRAGQDSFLVERSNDGGLRWSQLNVIGLPSGGGPQALAALPGGVYLLSTAAGTFRSADGGVTWRPLEGALNSGGVAAFLVLAGASPVQARTVLAATGYGIFISRDVGAIWQPSGAGLPFNSKIAGLLTHPDRPDQLFAISDNETSYGAATPPAMLRSLDGGRRWSSAAQNLPNVPITGWAIDPNDSDTVLLASWEHIFQSTDAGVSWRATRLPSSQRMAIAFAPSDSNTVYLSGRPASRSVDRGATWQDMPIPSTDPVRQTEDANALAVDPGDAQHLWAGLPSGIYESRDGGRSWRAFGLSGRSVRWLTVVPHSPQTADFTLYAGIAEDGIYRWDGAAWTATSSGLPAQSSVTAFVADAQTDTLWAARDGGGVYRSTDAGSTWTNAGVGLGDNLAQALAVSYDEPGAVLIGTATAGVWTLTSNVQAIPASGVGVSANPAVTPRAGVDARIEIVWPHDWAPVQEAKMANIGLRLFAPGSLLQPACGWRPRVTVWQALDSAPAAPLALADQRSVDGQPFPYWVLNDVDVSRANDPARKLYFLVRVEGVDTATSIWAHGADPRTYLPQPEVPSGIASGVIDAVDARIQIVWPHDGSAQRAVTEATLINVSVTFFKHGTRLSVPVGWRPSGVSLYGAWNQEVGGPLASQGEVVTRRSGAVSYPTWEFNNIPVTRAADPGSKLYLWVSADGVQTYPTIWAHGADSRTFFPATDEPIQGCVP